MGEREGYDVQQSPPGGTDPVTVATERPCAVAI